MNEVLEKNQKLSLQNSILTDWIDDFDQKNLIVLEFPSMKLTVSKKVILRRSTMIRNFLAESNECEYPIPINFSLSDIETFKKYLLMHNIDQLIDLEIIRYFGLD